ncbi:MAG: SCO family protein [Verrucomicrobiales bacterium]|nr:SCO family protein [Verrucomicrobiales bacterium]MCP5556197.1 SCO family protein [Verrucomicrobiaceae bacterium]
MKRSLAILFGALLIAAALSAEEKPQSFQVRGIVREVRPEKQQMIIKHEAIPGYMDAMVMPFSVRDAKLFNGVVAGDSVSFKLIVTDEADWVSEMKVLSREAAALPKPKALPEVKAGTVLDFTGIKLIDQDGKAFDLSGTRGRPVALTFFFTGCPVPNMCPLLASKFEAVQKLISVSDGNSQPLLVSISIDPRNDGPKVLARYAEAHHVNAGYWRLATGNLDDITRVALICGVNFWEEKGILTHSLRTLVIAPNGAVTGVFTDNEWAPSALRDALLRKVTQ